MIYSRCDMCMFCEEKNATMVRCSNADLACEMNWESTYYVQGFLELSLADGQDGAPCFWFVPKG